MSQDHDRTEDGRTPADETDPRDPGGEAEDDAGGAASDELAVELQRLTQENRRLRREYARAKRVTYRRTALGLAAVGVLAILGAVLFPDSETVLLTLGGIGVFGGVLTYYFTPERVVPETVGGSVYRAHAATGVAMRDELGLADSAVYVPLDADGAADGRPDPTAGRSAVRLFCPQSQRYELPPSDDLTQLFVASDGDDAQRGVSLRPTGASLFDEFETALTGELASQPDALAAQLSDALVEQFELARGTTVEADAERPRVSVGVSDCLYGDGTRFDHPVASFLGTGFAHGLDRPIRVEARPTDGDDADVVVTCRWDTNDVT